MRVILSDCGPDYKKCSGPFHYKTDFFSEPAGNVATWGVVLALARRWNRLFLLIEDDQGRIVFEHEIDVARLFEVDATAHRLVAQTAEMARNPQRDCERDSQISTSTHS